MGQRDFETKLYYQLSLDRLVPQDHLLRRIAEAVDFSFVRPLCRPFYSHTGQPSVDPVVIFKMLLLGYLYGITSERRLAEEVRLHLGYRWFLGYDIDLPTPDRSVLSKARARFGSLVFEEFFRQSIELCRQAGLMEEGPVYVDSTLMQASASVDSLTQRADVARPPLSVTEYLRRLDQDDVAAEAPPPDAEPPAGSPPSAGGPLLRPNQELQSRTDPEATLVNRPDFGRHLAYKAHMAVAGRRGQVITAAVATTGAEADKHLLPDVLWQHRRLSKHAIPAAVADAKVWNHAQLPLPRARRHPGLHSHHPLRQPAHGHLGTRALHLAACRGCLSLSRRRAAAAVLQHEGDAARALSSAQGQLRCLSVSLAARSFGDRALTAPLVGPRPGRRCAGTGREPVRNTAARRAEDLYLYRGVFGLAKRTARPETDALQGETPRPDPAVAHGGGDEHQASSPEQRTEARSRGSASLFSWASNLVTFSDLARTKNCRDVGPFGNNAHTMSHSVRVM